MNWQSYIEDEYFISEAVCTSNIWAKNKDFLSSAGFSLVKMDEWVLRFKAFMPMPCMAEMEKKRDELLQLVIS